MDKIAKINKVIQDYFDLNKSVSIIPAKDLMPYFTKAGIFTKDHRNGYPIREVLRKLDKSKSLHKIPFVIADRKQANINWFFGRTGLEAKPTTREIPVSKPVLKAPKTSGVRKDSDEHYIIDLCDELLGMKGSRQYRFPFLLGDAGTKLPVDVYYESLNLVIEFNEQQHTKAVKHFDKPDKLTVSGVHRGEQRKLYDKRKREVLPKHGIKVIDIPYHAFNCNSKGKIIRERIQDLEIVKNYIKNT